MFNNSMGYSLADIAAVTEGAGNNNGWGNGDGAWWIILFLIFRDRVMEGVARGGTKG